MISKCVICKKETSNVYGGEMIPACSGCYESGALQMYLNGKLQERKSPKRQIRPYKGGRFERINIRATQETKRLAEAEAARQNISVSDLFEQLIRSITNDRN